MKIGDEVYIHGYIDEIRKDIAIIRNEGGYFGTVKDEIKQEPKTDILNKIRAEIEQAYCKVENYYDHGRNYGLYMATQIIDKYRQEGEE